MSLDDLRKKFKELEDALEQVENNPITESITKAINAQEELERSVRQIKLPFGVLSGDEIEKVIHTLSRDSGWSIDDPCNKTLKDNFINWVSDIFSDHGSIIFIGQSDWQDHIEFLLTVPTSNQFLGKNIKIRVDVLLGTNGSQFILIDDQPVLRIGILGLKNHTEIVMVEFHRFKGIVESLMSLGCHRMPYKGKVVNFFPADNDEEAQLLKEAILKIKGVRVDTLQVNGLVGVYLLDEGVLV